MTLSVGQSIAIIAVCAACTFLERWLPWLLFGDYLTTAMLIWRLASYYLTIVLGYIAVVAERVTLRRAET